MAWPASGQVVTVGGVDRAESHFLLLSSHYYSNLVLLNSYNKTLSKKKKKKRQTDSSQQIAEQMCKRHVISHVMIPQPMLDIQVNKISHGNS